jgi:hypothetical protein
MVLGLLNHYEIEKLWSQTLTDKTGGYPMSLLLRC